MLSFDQVFDVFRFSSTENTTPTFFPSLYVHSRFTWHRASTVIPHHQTASNVSLRLFAMLASLSLL
jgi:hypothetical protein